MLLVAALLAMFFGSHGLQAAGFIVVVLILCLGAMAFLSSAGGSFTGFRRASGGGFDFSVTRERAAGLFEVEPDDHSGPRPQEELDSVRDSDQAEGHLGARGRRGR